MIKIARHTFKARPVYMSKGEHGDLILVVEIRIKTEEKKTGEEPPAWLRKAEGHNNKLEKKT